MGMAMTTIMVTMRVVNPVLLFRHLKRPRGVGALLVPQLLRLALELGTMTCL